MMINTKARYAVMAMAYMAQRDCGERPITLAEVSDAQEIPLSYLEQIFVLLRKSGLVSSVRGPGGGYKLVRPSDETRIADVILAVDESLKMTRCNTHGSTGCLSDKSRCLTHSLWEGLEEVILHYFRSITLADVCQKRACGTLNIPMLATHERPVLAVVGGDS